MIKKLLCVANVSIACITAPTLHAKEIQNKVQINTGININQLQEELSLDDLLTILSVGKLQALVSRPEIMTLLQHLEEALEVSYQNAVKKAYDDFGYSVDELKHKQVIVLAIYAALYKRAQQEIADHGTQEQQVIFAQQLAPAALRAIVLNQKPVNAPTN